MRCKTAALVAALLACALPMGRAQNVLVPDPPRFVAGPDIVSLDWSPSGRYLLAVRRETDRWNLDQTARASTSLVLWNREKQESRWLMTVQDRLLQVHWLPRSNIAFVRVSGSGSGAPTEVWRVDARTGNATKTLSVSKYADISISPTEPLAVVYGEREDGAYVRSLWESGGLGSVVLLNQADVTLWDWSTDGKTVYFFDSPPAAAKDAAVAGTIPESTWANRFPAFSPATGQLTRVTDKPKLYRPPASTAPFKLVTTMVKTTAGPRDRSPQSAPFAPTLHPLWLEQEGDKDFQRLFLAPDADRWVVSPLNDAVAYQNSEGAFVVPLRGVPLATLKEARKRAEVSELVNDGMQVAGALINWASRNGSAYPGAGSDIGALVNSYLKDPSILGSGGGFQYTFGGGPLRAS